ncbi:MAG: transglycosylase SLT domain-containing protein [Methylocystis sp.]
MGEAAPQVRALAVAGLLAGAFVAAATSERAEVVKPTPTPLRFARAPSSLSPILTLAQGDDSPLDSDFSLEQAARTWARRRAPGDQGDRPGTMRFGSMRVQRSIVERVVKAAKTTGSDPALLMSIADKESSFASSAKASTSSASGLFQFVESTWFKALKSFGWRYGREEEAKAIQGDEDHQTIEPRKRAEILELRNDPYLSAALAAEMLKRDGAKIAEHLGRSLTAGETYLIHFLGPEDAERFMQKMDAEPDASAAQLLPRPAKANKPIFYERQGSKLKDRSVSQVHDAFENMMGSRVSRYQDVETKLPKEAAAYAEP